MKTLRFLLVSLLVGLFSLNFIACSSDDEEPVIDEGPTLIETPIPADAEFGLYAIRHDKEDDHCTFKFYFGENPPVDNMIIVLWDWTGKYLGQFYLVAPTHPEYVESDTYVERWDGIRGYHSDVFTISCYMCESMLGKFNYYYTINVVTETGETKSQLQEIEIPWRPLHHFFE